jgi:hypothetical protein
MDSGFRRECGEIGKAVAAHRAWLPSEWASVLDSIRRAGLDGPQCPTMHE